MGDVVRVVRGGRFVGWYVRYVDADGKRKQRASHQPTKELARRYLVEVESRVARGKIGIEEPKKELTVKELFERFHAEYRRPKLKATYHAEVASAVKRWLTHLGDKVAHSLSTQEISKVRDKLLGSVSPGTVRVSLAYLKCAFAWALKHELIDRDPVKAVERPLLVTESVEYLARDEVARLLAKTDTGVLAVAVRLGLYLGLRKGEILGLRWRDLDLETGRITIARSFASTPKSGKARHLRIPEALRSVLAAWRANSAHAELVCPVRGKLAGKHETLGLERAMEAAHLRPLGWHALRHTFASHFIMRGGNILTLQKILGHSDIKVTLVYAHLAPDFLADELERVRY